MKHVELTPGIEARRTTLHRAVSIRALPVALMIAVLTACQAPVAENSVPENPSVVTLTGKITSAGGHQLLLSHAHLHDMTSMTHEASGDTEEWAHLYTELQTKYGHVRGLAYPLEVLNPNKPIKTGLPVPELKLTLLNGNEVSKETLKGSYVLLDFWATWCAPCGAKMPEVERTWAAHKDKSFQILSISFDSSLEAIQPFREKRFAMPWLHAHVEDGFESKLAEAFGVQSIPQPVLMDPDGIVVATEETLGRKDLYSTITAHLEGHAK